MKYMGDNLATSLLPVPLPAQQRQETKNARQRQQQKDEIPTEILTSFEMMVMKARTLPSRFSG